MHVNVHVPKVKRSDSQGVWIIEVAHELIPLPTAGGHLVDLCSF